MFEGAGWADAPGLCRCARTIENCSRIKMVVARASGMDLASILKRNTFLTLGVRPARGPGSGGPRGTGGHKKGPGTGGHGRAPATFYGGGTSPSKTRGDPPHKSHGKWVWKYGGYPSQRGCLPPTKVHWVPPQGAILKSKSCFASISTPWASQELS